MTMNEIMLGCPECSMEMCINSPLRKEEKQYLCSSNPSHRFCIDEQGMLRRLR